MNRLLARQQVQELAQRRALVRNTVQEFRGASKRMRQLKEGRQGAAANPSLRLMHANHMQEIRTRLEMLGYQRIARMLTQWHAYLMASRQAGNVETARQQVLLAREVSRDITRAIEGVR